MTKPQMFAMIFAMLITSALVSVGTVVGGVWYLKHTGEENIIQSLIGNAPLPFAGGKEQEAKERTFHSLDRVVLTVKGKKQQTHFVMLELAIETRRPEQIKEIDNYMPIIQNSLLKLFSHKTFDELQQAGTIETLQKEVKETLLKAFSGTPIISAIDDVLLTKYVVQ
ncbi:MULTISPECIES: flagellar basal body-associated FliL family protein [Vibrio]|uniref:flagellar basal body-associated FliL family protein n=1 Tax=Vibrio TaxID=662 RepID=UPI000C16A18C|nr:MULTISPECIES: flagellar basal body-associated FliL family protein [Vibrio]NAW70635.1 flagellar protein [Vibrio sp. V28_P6S34P95]NAX05096.1 flagellar protein [Vibrio sp. V30_P3S12P165]NAX35553.1 flagellar protein [Vibrio sp. V29_P1S30P107]NAX38926.1 flagellar protein [Vibrio sp. V27_P1S3P104]NAX40094.1 flagellar protein [Vibrio sp. V26_P1S5P106]